MFTCCSRLEGALAAVDVDGADVEHPLLLDVLLGLFDEQPEGGWRGRSDLLDPIAVEVCDLPREDEAECIR